MQKQIIKLQGELNTEREKNINITTKENTELNKIVKLYDEISENQKEIKILKKN